MMAIFLSLVALALTSWCVIFMAYWVVIGKGNGIVRIILFLCMFVIWMTSILNCIITLGGLYSG